jgi:hypothetical protein
MGCSIKMQHCKGVHRNIAAFGGDPNEVTIFEQSGRAFSVTAFHFMISAFNLISRTGVRLSSPYRRVTQVVGSPMSRFFLHPKANARPYNFSNLSKKER